MTALTPRQTEILQLLAEGFTAQEVADQLDMAVKTVKVHSYSLRKNLGARNTSHAVALGFREGHIA